MVQQDGEALQLNVRVGDFAINDISNIRVTDSGSATTFEMGIVSVSLCWMQIIMYYPTTYLTNMMVAFGASTAAMVKEKQPYTTTIKPRFTLPTFRIVRKRIM